MSVDPEQATPTGSAEPQDPTPPQHDWEQRYKDTQSWGQQAHDTLGNPEKLASFLKDNPERVNEVLSHLGFEVLNDDDDDIEPEPASGNESESDLARRLDEFEDWKQSQETAQATNERQAQWDGWEQHVKAKAKEQGYDLSSRDLKALKLDCVSQNGHPVPPEKAEAALAELITEETARFDEQVSARSKRPRVPHTVTGGGEPGGPKDPSDMTSEEKREHAVALLHAQGG